MTKGSHALRFVGLCIGTLLLTVLLAATGGSGTPFSFLYLFPLVFGALTLRPLPAVALMGLAILAYGSLFQLAPASLNHHDAGAMEVHLYGMYGGFGVTAIVLVSVVLATRRSRDRATAALHEARRLEETRRRVQALAALAAGASHELRTPLSTILLVATEQRRKAVEPGLVRDLDLLVEEVGRCQEVLTQLSHAGEGETWKSADLRAVLVDALPAGEDLTLVATGRAPVPTLLLAQVARRLVGNARRAGGDVRVTLTAGEQLRLEVADTGSGMAPEVLARAVEPFFTTRSEGEGQGLGLYYCDVVARQLGGALSVESAPGAGTTVTLVLPRPA